MKTIILFLLFMSCFALSENRNTNLVLSNDYYPLTKGTTWTYLHLKYYSLDQFDTMWVEIIGTQIIAEKEYSNFKITENPPGPYPYTTYNEFYRREADNIFSYEKGIDQIMYKFDVDSGVTWIYNPDSKNYDNRTFEMRSKNYRTTIQGVEYKNCLAIYSESKYGTDTDIFEEFAANVGRITRSNGLGGKWFLVDSKIVTDIPDNSNRNNSLNEFHISPNPAYDFIEISVGANGCSPLQSEIKIYDLYGQTVLSVGVQNLEFLRVDVSVLAPGVYFVRIGDKLSKFVKI